MLKNPETLNVVLIQFVKYLNLAINIWTYMVLCSNLVLFNVITIIVVPLLREGTGYEALLKGPQSSFPLTSGRKTRALRATILNNKGNNQILPIQFHCAVCIYAACLK